jgi:hypothetical protein
MTQTVQARRDEHEPRPGLLRSAAEGTHSSAAIRAVRRCVISLPVGHNRFTRTAELSAWNPSCRRSPAESISPWKTSCWTAS